MPSISDSRFKVVTGIISVVTCLFVVFVVVVQQANRTLAPANSGAIYGGKVEAGYPYAGYLLAFKSDGKIGLCSVAYLNSTTGVTAAHCIPNNSQIYLGVNVLSTDKNQNLLVSQILTKPEWDTKESNNDLSIVHIGEGSVNMPELAEPSTPALGCKYTVVGYGRSDTDPAGYTANQRKSAELCIYKVDKDLIYLNGSDSGICFGDSGSPVFETGTNRLVGIISAILPNQNDGAEPCYLDNKAVAVRVDVNSSFLALANSDLSSAKCGESCLTKKCGAGLTCDNENICNLNGAASCVTKVGQYCNPDLNVSCFAESKCSANLCVSLDDLASSTPVSGAALPAIDASNPLILLVGAGFVLGIIVVVYVWRRQA